MTKYKKYQAWIPLMSTYTINVIIYIYWIEIGGPNLKPIRWPYYSFMDNILFAIENHVSNQI